MSEPAAQSPVAEIDEAPDPRRWWALWACMVTLFLTTLGSNIVVIALPSIGTATGAQPAQLQWVISGYALTFGLVPIIAGRLGDDRGRKQMMLLGAAVFIVTSGINGFAPNANVLIIGRFAQGLAAGLINPQISGFIQNLFPRVERARAFSLIGVQVGIGSAAGPVLGGLIIYLAGPEYGWRIIFLMNVPIGLVALILAARWLPTIERAGPTRPLDLPGAGLLALALLAVLYPAVEYDAHRDVRLAYLLLPAAVLFLIFYWWEAGPARRRGYPLIDLGLFRIRSYSDGWTLAIIYFGCLTAIPLVLTLYLQDGLGYSAIKAAGIGAALALGVATSSFISGRLLPRYGAKLLVVAIGVLIIGLICIMLVTWFAVDSVPIAVAGVLLVAPLAITGFGMGGVTSPNQVLTYTHVDAAQGSTAAGMLQTSQRIGLAVGSAVGSAVFYSVALHGDPVSGTARATRYANAFGAGIGYVLVLAVISLLIAIRSVAHFRAESRDEENARVRLVD